LGLLFSAASNQWNTAECEFYEYSRRQMTCREPLEVIVNGMRLTLGRKSSNYLARIPDNFRLLCSRFLARCGSNSHKPTSGPSVLSFWVAVDQDRPGCRILEIRFAPVPVLIV
jgi:hypothetical protein